MLRRWSAGLWFNRRRLLAALDQPPKETSEGKSAARNFYFTRSCVGDLPWRSVPEVVKNQYCFVQLRFRFKQRSDPRFYYAPKGKNIDTSPTAEPFVPPPRRRKFPAFNKVKKLDVKKLKKEMKPKTRGRNAFKRRWQRWLTSLKDKRLYIKNCEANRERRLQKAKERGERMKQLMLEWEEKKSQFMIN